MKTQGQLWRWFCLGLLGLALGFGVVRAAEGTVLEWNCCLLAVGIVALAYWLVAPAADLAPAPDRGLLWATLLAPAYIALQVVPLPLFLLNVLSPARAREVASLGSVMPVPRLAALSITPGATAPYLLNVVAYTVVFLLVRDIGWRSRWHRAWTVFVPVIVIGALEASLGLAQIGSNAAGQPNQAVVHGTYPNRNNLAGFLEMVLPMTIASGIALVGGGRRGSVPMARTLTGIVVLCVATLIGAGLIASSSKMGFVAGLCGLFAMGVLALITRVHGARKWVGVAGLVLLCALLFLALPTDRLVGAFGGLVSEDLSTLEGRLPVWRDTLKLLADYPLFGSGFGNFGTAFLQHQTSSIGLALTFAHNDYLQLGSELGLVGLAIFFYLMLTVVTYAVRAARNASEWDARALAWGCIGAIVAIAVHSFADFNIYIPATPLVLSWIAGIAACLPLQPTPNPGVAQRQGLRTVVLVLTVLLVTYASARIAAETTFTGDLTAESRLCRIGICDTNGVLEAQTREHDGNAAAVPMPFLLHALRRDAANPDRWCTVGEAMLKAGRVEQARACFSRALELGPNDPPAVFRAARFYYAVGDHTRALTLTSRTLENTWMYDSGIFYWYAEIKAPVGEILADGLGTSGRPLRAYLRHVIGERDFDRAAEVWDRLLSRGFADDLVARDYVNFLYADRRYETAARAWAAFLGDRAKGYLRTTWLFNGGFESELSKVPFDWQMGNLGEAVQVSVDSAVAHGGGRSLQLRFAGTENVGYRNTTEAAFVTPGLYRFQAFVRADGLTTDQRIRFRISGDGVDVTTDQIDGTSDWAPIEHIVQVPERTNLLIVEVVRQKSLKFDSQISGRAWIDDVSLTRVE